MKPNVKSFKEYLEEVTMNRQRTENGALMYKTTHNDLVDLNFKVSALRSMSDNQIKDLIKVTDNKFKFLTLLWIFYLRDCRGGLGERRSGRLMLEAWVNKFLQGVPDNEYKYPYINFIKAVLEIVPEYGRWDDLVEIAVNKNNESVIRYHAANIILRQIQFDLDFINNNGNASLLGKWLPSVNASKNTRVKALRLIKMFKDISPDFIRTEKRYRKIVSELRQHCGTLIEHNLCDYTLNSVDLNKVSAGAHLKYRGAFTRRIHDEYFDYLKDVAVCKAKMNNNGVPPYKILHNMLIDERNPAMDHEIRELIYNTAWQNLLDSADTKLFEGLNLKDTIVVCDGSASMTDEVPGSNIRAIEISRSLAIYCANKLSGSFKNTVIEFSARPKFIDLGDKNFVSQYNILRKYTDCSNTNIAAVFDLLLSAVRSGKFSKEDLPDQILIVSDMQFDTMTRGYYRSSGYNYVQIDDEYYDTLFHQIASKWDSCGLKLPKLVFWNVCSRSTFEVIPMTSNYLGVSLISGFNVEALKATTEKDPAESLLKALFTERYENIIGGIQRYANGNLDEEIKEFLK